MQLDDACRKSLDKCGIGGSLLLLSVWMWERFPVGRSRPPTYQPWDDKRERLRRATWAYAWDVVEEYNGDTEKDYVLYTNEFDALTPEQVIFVMISWTCTFM